MLTGTIINTDFLPVSSDAVSLPLRQFDEAFGLTRLFKVAAEITVSCRCVLVRLSGNWPYLDHYRHVAERALALSSAPADPPVP